MVSLLLVRDRPSNWSSERKSNKFNSNAKAVLTHGKIISFESKVFTGKLEEFLKSTSHHHERLRTRAKQFCTSELETLAAQSERIDQQLQRVQDALGVIQAQDKLSQEAIIVVKDVVKDTSEKVKNELKTWSEDLMKNCDTLSKEVEATALAGSLWCVFVTYFSFMI